MPWKEERAKDEDEDEQNFSFSMRGFISPVLRYHIVCIRLRPSRKHAAYALSWMIMLNVIEVELKCHRMFGKLQKQNHSLCIILNRPHRFGSSDLTEARVKDEEEEDEHFSFSMSWNARSF